MSKEFTELLKSKIWGKRFLILTLSILSGIMLLLPWVSIYFPNILWKSISFNQPNLISNIYSFLFRGLPLIFTEAIVFYLFRVILHRFQNIAAEITQIDNRLSLSKFIIPYFEYTKRESKGNEAAMLEKFNEIIFKPIVTEHKDLPKLIDGEANMINLISKLIKSKH